MKGRKWITDGLNGEQLKFANVIVLNKKWAKLDDKGYLYFQNIDNNRNGTEGQTGALSKGEKI